MKVWIVSFVLLFGAAEFLQWVRQFSLPLPIFILGGAFLAIASNYDKLKDLPFHLDYEPPESAQKEVPAVPSATSQPVNPTNKRTQARSISFEVRKPFEPGN